MTSLHREGILVAATPLENPMDPAGAPPNIAFLEILTEFTNKLLKQDKKVRVLLLIASVRFFFISVRGEFIENVDVLGLIMHLLRPSLI